MLSPMPASTITVSDPARPRWNLVTRLVSILLLAFVIGWILNRVGQQLSRSHHPAGFVRGLVLHDHDRVTPFAEKLQAAPLSLLW